MANRGTSSLIYIDPETDKEHEVVFDWYYCKGYPDEPPGTEVEIIEVRPPLAGDFVDFVFENADWAELRYGWDD